MPQQKIKEADYYMQSLVRILLKKGRLLVALLAKKLTLHRIDPFLGDRSDASLDTNTKIFRGKFFRSTFKSKFFLKAQNLYRDLTDFSDFYIWLHSANFFSRKIKIDQFLAISGVFDLLEALILAQTFQIPHLARINFTCGSKIFQSVFSKKKRK